MNTQSASQSPIETQRTATLQEPGDLNMIGQDSTEISDTPQEVRGISKEKWSTIGGVFSAFLSSICCIGPLIFSALGIGAGATGFLGGSARFAAFIAPYRLFFVVLTFAFLGLSFYSVYRKEKMCRVASVCSLVRLKKTKIFLWIITAISLILLISPYLLAIGS
jgi:mercuric ion transport protein